MKHNKSNVQTRAPGLQPVSDVAHADQKEPRGKAEPHRKDKGSQGSHESLARRANGQNTPGGNLSQGGSEERVRTSGRGAFGGYQGL